MKRTTIGTVLVLTIVGICIFGSYWTNTQPVWIVANEMAKDVLDNLPLKNKQIVELIEINGKEIAPNYKDVACTEFVIKVIDNFDPLTQAEKNDIRIITKQGLDSLIINESPIIRGVQTALLDANKGTRIDKIEDIKPGDFVQFWNLYLGKQYGHCGVVFQIDPNRTITLYSSHPLTDGYGKQAYLWPDKLYAVRLK
jgi:hypothetical protein